MLASEELKCLPGVYDVLDLLDARAVATALVTNAPPSEMEFALGALQVCFYLAPECEWPAISNTLATR